MSSIRSRSGALLRPVVGVLAAAILLPWAESTRAADTAVDASSSELGEVVVTATRREEKLNDVPVSVSVLSGDPLQVLGDSGQDIKQLAFQVPSLNIESSNGRAFPRFYIRGYGNTDFHDFASQPVGLVYDDIVQENAALKGFPIFDQADVEVLRGPQGTLFGRNSPAGVVKLESAKPVLGESSGFVSLSDGTYNTSVFQGVVNFPVNDQVAFRGSVQGQHRDNWVNDQINDSKLGGFDDWAARLQWLFKPSDGFTALLNVHGRYLGGSSTLFRANIIEPGSNALVQGFNRSEIYTDGPNTAALTTVGTNLHLTWTLPGYTLQSITGYESVRKYFSLGDIDGGYGPGNVFCQPTCTVPTGPGPVPFAVETSAGLKSHTQLTEEFRVVSNLDGPVNGQAGVFVFYENVTAADDDYCAPGGCDTTVPPTPPFALQDTTVSTQINDAEAAFASVNYTPIEPFTATAGLRFTEDHKTFRAAFTDFVPPASNAPTPPLSDSITAHNVSWDVSGTYKLTQDTNVYARIATGFRAPSFGEPSAGVPIQMARSETNRSYEVGVKSDLFERRARIAFDVFYYDVANQQLTAVGGVTNSSILLNAERATGDGAELDFEAHPIPNLTVNISGSLNITKIEDPSLAVGVCFSCTVLNPLNAKGDAEINGNPLPQAAKWVGDFSVRYDFPLAVGGKVYAFTDWSARSGVNFLLYESKEFDGTSLVQGGFRLGYTWADGKYDVAAFCRNCTNQIRAIGAIDFDNLTGYINDPRIIGGQFRAKF